MVFQLSKFIGSIKSKWASVKDYTYDKYTTIRNRTTELNTRVRDKAAEIKNKAENILNLGVQDVKTIHELLELSKELLKDGSLYYKKNSKFFEEIIDAVFTITKIINRVNLKNDFPEVLQRLINDGIINNIINIYDRNQETINNFLTLIEHLTEILDKASKNSLIYPMLHKTLNEKLFNVSENKSNNNYDDNDDDDNNNELYNYMIKNKNYINKFIELCMAQNMYLLDNNNEFDNMREKVTLFKNKIKDINMNVASNKWLNEFNINVFLTMMIPVTLIKTEKMYFNKKDLSELYAYDRIKQYIDDIIDFILNNKEIIIKIDKINKSDKVKSNKAISLSSFVSKVNEIYNKKYEIIKKYNYKDMFNATKSLNRLYNAGKGYLSSSTSLFNSIFHKICNIILKFIVMLNNNKYNAVYLIEKLIIYIYIIISITIICFIIFYMNDIVKLSNIWYNTNIAITQKG